MAAQPNKVFDVLSEVPAFQTGSPRAFLWAMREAIRTDQLVSYQRLPTMEAVAQWCGISRSSVVRAWSTLRAEQLIVTSKRGGSFVAPKDANQFGSAGLSPLAWREVDLANGAGDPALIPAYAEALVAASADRKLNSSHIEPITRALLDVVKQQWSFPGTVRLALPGYTEALNVALSALPRGATLAVVTPGVPGVLPIALSLGLNVIPVSAADETVFRVGVREAVNAGASALFIESSGAFSFHGELGEAQAQTFAEVIDRVAPDVLVIEHDVLGPLNEVHAVTDHLKKTPAIKIVNFCRALGLDLKTAVIGTGEHQLQRMSQQRVGGIPFVSRVLQNAVAFLLRDEEAQRQLASARARYEHRRIALSERLTHAGVAHYHGDGSVVIWAEVQDELRALAGLQARGLTVGESRSFVLAPGRAPLVRIGTTQLPDESSAKLDELADAVAAESHGLHEDAYFF